MCDEKLRVMALKSYRILDTPSDEHLDLLTQLTARFCDVPVALISLVDNHRQWAKSIFGVRIYEETPREVSFCEHTIGGDEIFEVTNTEDNDQFRDNPLVTDAPHIRFYAGAPLITPSGHKIGALCVLDMVPRQLSSKQRSALLEMSRLVMQRLEMQKEMTLLKHSELQLADLIENTSDLIQSVSPEGLMLFANQTWLNTLGYTKSDLPSLNIFEIIHPDCQAHCGALFQRLMEGEDIGLVDVIFRSKEGRPVPLEGRITVRFEDGKPAATRAIFRDVTERKRVQKELEVREARYRGLINNIPGAVYRFSNDENGHCNYVSPPIKEITGFAPAEFLRGSPTYSSIIYKDDFHSIRGLKMDRLLKRKFYDVEYRLIHKDGSIRWVREQGRENPDNAKELEGTIFDITEQKMVRHKEAEAKKEAEAANLAKSKFLSRMSHELRTPLHSIIGFSKILEMAELSEKQARNAKRISHAGKHLLNLINEVLDLSRIEAGEIYSLSENVKIESVIDEVILLVRPMAAEHSIQIVHKTSGHDIQAFVDRQLLLQVLLNLASNGIKYNRHEGTLNFEVMISSSGRVRIEVRDSGEGIAKNKLPRLFIPFDRLDVEIGSPALEGAGLGLSITKKLVEFMGGEITVHSKQGKGSVFAVMFDMAKSDHNASKDIDVPQVKHPEHTHLDASVTDLASIKILYIEDNQDNVALIEQVTEYRERVKLIVAIQGGQGIELARQHQPDLIFLDFHLPDLNGDEVLHRLLGDKRTRDIPVYMLSADAMQKQIKRLKGLGVVDYLTKPLDIDLFLSILDEKLAKKNIG